MGNTNQLGYFGFANTSSLHVWCFVNTSSFHVWFACYQCILNEPEHEHVCATGRLNNPLVQNQFADRAKKEQLQACTWFPSCLASFISTNSTLHKLVTKTVFNRLFLQLR